MNVLCFRKQFVRYTQNAYLKILCDIFKWRVWIWMFETSVIRYLFIMSCKYLCGILVRLLMKVEIIHLYIFVTVNIWVLPVSFVVRDVTIFSSPVTGIAIAWCTLSSSVNFYIFILFSETTRPIGTKHWMVPYKLCFFWLIRGSQETRGPKVSNLIWIIRWVIQAQVSLYYSLSTILNFVSAGNVYFEFLARRGLS